jgi:hypothetical protein
MISTDSKQRTKLLDVRRRHEMVCVMQVIAVLHCFRKLQSRGLKVVCIDNPGSVKSSPTLTRAARPVAKASQPKDQCENFSVVRRSPRSSGSSRRNGVRDRATMSGVEHGRTLSGGIEIFRRLGLMNVFCCRDDNDLPTIRLSISKRLGRFCHLTTSTH